MFLSAYENDSWKLSSRDWVEERQDGAVEVIATRADGTELAIEHTLVQPFVGEKFDSDVFMKAFGRIEKNTALVLPGRHLDVSIPVHAIPKGYDWNGAGEELLRWLAVNHSSEPMDGKSEHANLRRE
jgi:hypothetical protein